jgi:hypothetical protein
MSYSNNFDASRPRRDNIAPGSVDFSIAGFMTFMQSQQ